MKKTFPIPLVIICLITLLTFTSCSDDWQMVIPLSKWEEVRPEKEVNLTLKEVVEKAWVNNLLDLPQVYPEGILSRGIKEKRIAANYHVAVSLTDLNQSADLRFHQTESDIEQPSKYRYPVRQLLIKTESQEMSNKLILKMKDKLKEYFPKGAPFQRASKEIGYVVLNNENCGDITIEWSTDKLGERNTARLIIQCHPTVM